MESTHSKTALDPVSALSLPRVDLLLKYMKIPDFYSSRLTSTLFCFVMVKTKLFESISKLAKLQLSD